MSEDLEQIHLVRWMGFTRWQGRPLTDHYWHVPNGGSRHPIEARKLKLMGVKPGVPDIFGALPVGTYHGHFVEMKAPGGRVRPEQREIHERLRGRGYRVDVCFGWHEAKAAIEHYLGPAGVLTETGG